MAGNRKKKRYRLSVFPLFPRFQPPRLKSSSSTSRLKNKEPMQETPTDDEPSSSQTPKKRKSWHTRISKVKRFLFYPLSKKCSGFISSLKRGKKLSRFVFGCHKGALQHTNSSPCKSPSDETDPAEFSHVYVKTLLENNNFFTNASINKKS
eukprot:Gb_29708 [translate_table: standard]